MEVHHHPIAIGSHTSRKKWTHYFWEFLMLFLAVFCGFFAEYQLEHKIERDKEKQYLRSLLEDLHEDTISLTETIHDFDAHLKRNDTLIRLLTQENIKQNGADLYYLARRASRSVRLAVNDFTIQQMKSSGGFRLIRNQKVSKAVIEYYNRIIFINYLNSIESQESGEYRIMATEVFHPLIFNGIVNADNTISRPLNNPSLLTYDSKILLRLAGMVSYIRNTKMGLMKAETEMKAAATELIQLIKKEYHFN